MPIIAAESAPKAWLKAVRCGTAVICTRPRGMPTPAPMTSGMRTHLYWHYLGIEEGGADCQRCADLSRQNAPARARRRTQELERKNEEYDRDDVGEIEILLQCRAGSLLFRPAGLEHAQHAVGDQESAHHVAEGGGHGDRTQRPW